jgi:diacylglycerol O-acyltransferase / wax synthase
MSFPRLSFQDAHFLLQEPQPIFATAIVFRAEDGAVTPTINDLRARVRNCLSHVPELRRRAVRVPGDIAAPVWVDVEDFDFEYHVRRFGPQREVSVDELAVISGRLMSLRMDMSKPLWRFLVVEKVAGGRFSVVAQMHHGMGDGLAALGLFVTALMDLGGFLPTDPSPPPWNRGDAPTQVELVREALVFRARSAFGALRASSRALRPTRWPDVARTTKSVYRITRPTGDATEAPPWEIRAPERPHVDYWQASLSDMKRIRNALAPAGTINDVVLSAVAHGMWRYYQHAGRPARDTWAMVPFSFRPKWGAVTPAGGNAFSHLRVRLPVTEADPVKRLRTLQAQTHELKQIDAAEANALLSHLLERKWIPERLVRSMNDRVFSYDCLVSNIPGPQVPMYCFGSELEAVFPVQGPVAGLSLTLISVRDSVCFALSVGSNSMPAPRIFVEGVKSCLDTLREAAARVRAVQGVALFAPLPESLQLELGSGLEEKVIRSGAVVFEQGAVGDSFYIVRSGTLEVVEDEESRRVLGSGDSFGEIALVEEIARTATVRAVTDSRLWLVERDTFMAVVSQDRNVRKVAHVLVDSRLGALGE